MSDFKLVLKINPNTIQYLSILLYAQSPSILSKLSSKFWNADDDNISKPIFYFF